MSNLISIKTESLVTVYEQSDKIVCTKKSVARIGTDIVFIEDGKICQSMSATYLDKCYKGSLGGMLQRINGNSDEMRIELKTWLKQQARNSYNAEILRISNLK